MDWQKYVYQSLNKMSKNPKGSSMTAYIRTKAGELKQINFLYSEWENATSSERIAMIDKKAHE